MSSMPSLTDHSAEHRVTYAEFELIRARAEGSAPGHRYELLEGEVLVTPSPSFLHQHVVRRLMALLEGVLTEATAMLPAPFDVVLQLGPDGDTVLKPDLVVGDLAPDGDALVLPPRLVAEVLSPSTWRRDLGDKRNAYASAGVEHYWVVAPDTPSVTCYRLDADGDYREVTHLVGDQEGRPGPPFDVVLCPARMVSP